MSRALAIHSYPGGNETLKRHWPFFQRADFDEIIVIGTEGGGCWCPEGVRQEIIGPNRYVDGGHLPTRLLCTFDILLKTPHDWLCVAEYDVLVLKPFPRDLPLGLTTHLAGGKPAGYRCNVFYHSPWYADRETARIIVDTGYKIVSEGISDFSPDCHMGQVVERAHVLVHTDILKSYSQNTIATPDRIAEARAAIDAGAVCVHGCKSAAVFEALTK